MVTTIQINESTIKLLKAIKERTNASSYDEVITKFLKERDTKSYAGAFSGGKKWTRKEILEGLRDKHDRI